MDRQLVVSLPLSERYRIVYCDVSLTGNASGMMSGPAVARVGDAGAENARRAAKYTQTFMFYNFDLRLTYAPAPNLTVLARAASDQRSAR